MAEDALLLYPCKKTQTKQNVFSMEFMNKLKEFIVVSLKFHEQNSNPENTS